MALQALRDASVALQSAIDNERNGTVVQDEPAAMEDPDDAAAAFFAQQARKQQQAQALPTKSWARMLVRNDAREDAMRESGNAPGVQPTSKHDDDMEALVDRLFQTFQDEQQRCAEVQ